MLIINEKYLKYLVILTPLGLITGPFFADLFLSLAGITFIFKSIEKKLWFYWTHSVSKIFWLFCIYILIRSLVSSDIMLSLESSMFYFRFGLYTLCVWYLCDTDKNFINTFGKYFLLIFAFVILDASMQKIIGLNITLNSVNSERLSGIFGDELILGSYLSRLMPLAFGFCVLFSPKNRYIVPVFLIFLIIIDVVIFYSGERTAFFYLLLGSFVILIFSKNWKILRIITLAISIVIISYISVYDSKIKDRMITQTLNQTGITGFIDEDNINENIQVKSKFLKLNFFSPVHEPHLISAVKMFQNNIFFGVGPKLFRIKCANDQYYIANGCSTHPHNTYFQLLAEIGFIGFIFIFSAFSIIIWILFKQLLSIFFSKQRYLNDFQICLLTCILISLWPFAPSNNFFNNWISVVYYIPVGIFLSSFFKRRD